MAILRYKEIKDISSQELRSKLQDLRKELMKVNFQRTTKAVSNPGRVKEIKRSVARILTAIHVKNKSINQKKLLIKASAK